MSARRGDEWIDLQTHDPSDSLSGACRANLYVYQPSGRIDWFALNLQRFLLNARFSFTFGREPTCDITLNDPAVSGQHAQLCLVDGRLKLEDLGSKNGVRVNGEACEEWVLRHGDVITFGATDVRFLYGYPKTPRHLTLTFEEGPLEGRKIATFGTSTTLGRARAIWGKRRDETLRYGEAEDVFNAIQIPGEGIGARQVRLDVYGPKLIYLLNLDADHEVKLNGALVEGIVSARVGDRVTVGEHTLRLSLLDAAALNDATLQPDGTMLLAEGKTPLPEGLMQLDGALLEAASSEPPEGDEFEGCDEGEPGPDEPIRQDSDELDFSKAFRSFVHASEDDTWADNEGLANTDELALIDAALHQNSATLSGVQRRAWSRWVPLIVLGLVGLVALSWPVSRRAGLEGQLEVARRAPLIASEAGRIERVLVQPDQRVEAGQIVAQISEEITEAQLDALGLEIEALKRRLSEEASPTPSAEVLAILRAELEELVGRREALEAKRLAPLKAPIDGVLSGAPLAPGSRVSAGRPLAEIVDERDLVAHVAIPPELLSHPEWLEVGALQVQGTRAEARLELAPISKVPDQAGSFFIKTPLGRCASAGTGTRCEGPNGAFNSDAALRLGQKITIWVDLPSRTGWGRIFGGDP